MNNPSVEEQALRETLRGFEQKLLSLRATKADMDRIHGGSSKRDYQFVDDREALYTETIKAIQTQTHTTDKVKEAERLVAKAYGGCEKCYGKGYATTIEYQSSRLGKRKVSPIKYCSCDRGKQLEELSKSHTKQLLDRVETEVIGEDEVFIPPTTNRRTYKEIARYSRQGLKNEQRKKLNKIKGEL